jgi:hypothetical protein
MHFSITLSDVGEDDQLDAQNSLRRNSATGNNPLTALIPSPAHLISRQVHASKPTINTVQCNVIRLSG